MKRLLAIPLVVLAFLAIALGWRIGLRLYPRAQKPLPQQAYLWQRAWNDNVRQAVQAATPKLSGMVVLAAEVSWQNHQSTIVRIPIDYEALRSAGIPVGLALRIGAYAGPFDKEGEPLAMLTDLAASLIAEAREAQLDVQELQLDFDCAESKLSGYRWWMEAIRSKVAPVPVTITVLPSWLHQREFQDLIEAAGGYVLQVHWFSPPKNSDTSLTLCDPSVTWKWVKEAARFGKPFRLALPTYSYLVAFDRQGKYIGFSAEGPALAWPHGAEVRRVESDPGQMAALVRKLAADRPEELTGIIWYRLPTPSDRLNWPWPTLAAVMDGRPPRELLRAETRSIEPGLVDIDLVNKGETEALTPVEVLVSWQNARLLAGDALSGFRLIERGPSRVALRGIPGSTVARIGPDQRQPIGWLRFDRETEVELHVSPLSP
ncbi:MAG: hypothetical protein A2V67_15190 [Deltaproteobacteria bacterium RBG_13_61_14]|nr:MAG: hypothetical protein A2V67_15190 [Deltaproteobacteria bacterium RBG_13_61_14]